MFRSASSLSASQLQPALDDGCRALLLAAFVELERRGNRGVLEVQVGLEDKPEVLEAVDRLAV
jgi:hypothetical protein